MATGNTDDRKICPLGDGFMTTLFGPRYCRGESCQLWGQSWHRCSIELLAHAAAESMNSLKKIDRSLGDIVSALNK